jgi:hypothetical protein
MRRGSRDGIKRQLAHTRGLAARPSREDGFSEDMVREYCIHAIISCTQAEEPKVILSII